MGKSVHADAFCLYWKHFGGGMVNKESDPIYHTAAWKRIRRAALLRDHGMCCECMKAYLRGTGARPRRATLVHHIIPIKERPDLAFELDNLESLCEVCHNRAHPEKGAQNAREAKHAPTEGVRIIKI